MDNLFRKLPHFRGKERMARLFMAGAINDKKDVRIAGRNNCTYLLPNILENVGFDIFINGEYEPGIQDLILKLLPEDGIFLDLGANIGSIIVPIAKRRPSVTAFGVEAAPWIFEYLKKNVAANNLKNVHLIGNALFNEDGKELDFFSPHDKYGKGSLSPVFTRESVKVITKKLDSIVNEKELKNVDLIKVDVEGFEYFVFKGGEKLLSSVDAPNIIFEFVDWAEERAMGLKPGYAQQLLIEMGYTLYTIDGSNINKLDAPIITGSSNLLASKHAVKFV